LRQAVALLASRSSITEQSRRIGNLSTAKCEEEEQKGTTELGRHGNELVAPFARESPLPFRLCGLFRYDMPVGSLAVFMMVMMFLFSVLILLVKGQYVLESHNSWTMSNVAAAESECETVVLYLCPFSQRRKKYIQLLARH
jgi:hypothetical protein